MSKERSEKKEKKQKREKKIKKEKRSETEGVHKSKKEKKEKKAVGADPAEDIKEILATKEDVAAVVSHSNDTNGVADTDMLEDGTEVTAIAAKPQGALVPFANPLADDKSGKKVLKSVKKAAKSKALKRGVKEVVKALRKSPVSTSASAFPIGVVVLAADISPMDVISHIPVLCEDHGIPYIYVTSRAELGAAGSTKRPTSVVMIGQEKGKVVKKEGDKEGEGDDWEEVYKDLVKIVMRASKDVRK